jgi:hypothetical protein
VLYKSQQEEEDDGSYIKLKVDGEWRLEERNKRMKNMMMNS